MTPTGMGHTSPPLDQFVAPDEYRPSLAPELPPYEPLSTPVRARRSWRTAIEGRERRLWTAALAAALLVSAAGLGALYVDDTNNQATIRDLQTRNENLTGQNQNLNDQLKVTEGQLTVSRQQVTDLSNELQHPTLGVWNVPMTIPDSSVYLSSTVPDTFTYHLKLTSTGPMNVSILSTKQFAAALQCVWNGVGDTNYCMHHSGATRSWLNLTSVNADFTLSEGCAAYLAIITAPSAVTITPNVSVTYNPASAATGACS